MIGGRLPRGTMLRWLKLTCLSRIEQPATGTRSPSPRPVHLQFRRLEHERDDHRHERGPGYHRQGIQIAITIFLLVMAALMIPGGKLTDRYGRKRLFMLGLIVYAVGAVRALAPGLGVLIIGNSILEGVGTAMLIPPVLHPHHSALHRPDIAGSGVWGDQRTGRRRRRSRSADRRPYYLSDQLAQPSSSRPSSLL